ncbi:subtilisin-like protease [Olea europaea subsp. europaea]|uniref:Subtilisin-like protease n=1 Tax=Olea europaea subsp. europaea TaxID=158383 RepID=A0A8S0RGC0_OLEEU|nr:subtilisin-like protease [Olea europaea subsp. europaea]
MTRECDIFLESFLEKGSYIKLYSYTHLLNGFAIYLTDEKVFRVLETGKREKCGSILAGKGVVISLIDTRINPFHLSFTNEDLGESCQNENPFIRSFVSGKLTIYTYTFDFESKAATIATVAALQVKSGPRMLILALSRLRVPQ